MLIMIALASVNHSEVFKSVLIAFHTSTVICPNVQNCRRMAADVLI